MTLQETGELCLFIRRTTHAWAKEDSESFMSIVRDWHDCLKDVPYDMAKKSAVEYISENSFQPTIADVRKCYREYLEQQKQLRQEYNNIYSAAISHYPCYEDTKEVRAEFDRITGKSVSKATRFSSILIDYVRGCEMAEEYIPPILDWMKGVKEID